jgi:addiction module HigA family antidote
MTRIAIHPGEHIADEIEAQSLSASELARALHIPTNRLTEIIRGRRGVSADTALRLAQWLGTSPEYWMNLQRNYELRLAEQAHGEEIRSTIIPLPKPASAV